MELLPERFCFIRCLKSDDQILFINAYIIKLNFEKTSNKSLYNDMIEDLEKGSIRILLWKELMESIKLKIKYVIHRRAYLGEKYGRSLNCTEMRKIWVVAFILGSAPITVNLKLDKSYISPMIEFDFDEIIINNYCGLLSWTEDIH